MSANFSSSDSATLWATRLFKRCVCLCEGGGCVWVVGWWGKVVCGWLAGGGRLGKFSMGGCLGHGRLFCCCQRRSRPLFTSGPRSRPKLPRPTPPTHTHLPNHTHPRTPAPPPPSQPHFMNMKVVWVTSTQCWKLW
jgi:hypothetical protein